MNSIKPLSYQLLTARKAAGMTQAELAKAAGIGIRSIYKIETGEPTNTATLEKLNRALGTQFIIGE